MKKSLSVAFGSFVIYGAIALVNIIVYKHGHDDGYRAGFDEGQERMLNITTKALLEKALEDGTEEVKIAN